VPSIKPEYTVKSTKENLDDDIKGEAYEATTMYPEFLKAATDANNELAYLSLTYAMKTERKHKIFYEKALGDINSNTLKTLPSEYYVCPVCGNTYETTAPKHCDFSMTPREKFIRINSL
jgi:rubrerythrin